MNSLTNQLHSTFGLTVMQQLLQVAAAVHKARYVLQQHILSVVMSLKCNTENTIGLIVIF